MKNRIKMKKSDYAKIKIKLFFQMIAIMILALGVVYSFYVLFWKGRGGDWVVSILQKYFFMEEWNALFFYQRLFRDHAEVFWIGGIIIVFLVLICVLINRFTAYFELINNGISVILSEDGKIDLPSEMMATERKLEEVKKELQRRTLESKLAEQRKNELVMYLAHDIRTPLTSVIGYLSLLEEAPDMPMEQKSKYIGITLDKAYRLDRMVNEFFEITRYNFQQIHIVKESIDLHYLFVQLVEEFSPVLNENGNHIDILVPEDMVLYADPDKIARVFQNILRNASAYSFPDTKISVTAEKKDDKIEIIFSNHGHTIPPHKLERIFEKFYRLDDSRATNNGGSGLGLAISKEIVLLHGGTITAKSENNTVSFIILLPVS